MLFPSLAMRVGVVKTCKVQSLLPYTCSKQRPKELIQSPLSERRDYYYENLTATDWGWTKHLFFHFVFVFIIIFSCPFVSFFHVNVCFRLHHHLFYTPTGAFSCVIAFIVCVP